MLTFCKSFVVSSSTVQRGSCSANDKHRGECFPFFTGEGEKNTNTGPRLLLSFWNHLLIDRVWHLSTENSLSTFTGYKASRWKWRDLKPRVVVSKQEPHGLRWVISLLCISLSTTVCKMELTRCTWQEEPVYPALSCLPLGPSRYSPWDRATVPSLLSCAPWPYFSLLWYKLCVCKSNCCSVTKSHPTLCDPMDCSTPGFPVLHYLLGFAQIHVHWVGDAVQPSRSLLPSSPFALNLSQHQGLFQWVSSLHQVAKVLELQLQRQSFQWIFGIDFL